MQRAVPCCLQAPPTACLSAASARPCPRAPCCAQKYWHKGAFFQGDDEEGVLGDVLRRDYDAPTGEDKVDKDMLPKIMQARALRRLAHALCVWCRLCRCLPASSLPCPCWR